MANATPRPATPAWPLARGEHPDLPRLRLELHEGRPATAGRKPTAAIPPYVRVLISPINVLVTSNPDRLDAWANQLHALAESLRNEHHIHTANTGQLPLNGEEV